MLPVDLSNDIVQDKSKLHLIRDESAGKSTIKVRNEATKTPSNKYLSSFVRPNRQNLKMTQLK